MCLKPEEQRGGDNGDIVKSLSGRFCWKRPWLRDAVGFGSVPLHFPTVFLSVAFSFYTHREGLVQGVIP